MANKRRLEERNKVAKAQQTQRTIQMIGFGVILVLILAGGWYFSSRRKTQTPPQLSSSDAAACAAFSDIQPAAQYSQPPMKIDVSKQYFAHVKMATGGEFVIQLYPDKAPITVNSFVFLACKNYFNGVTFHRVLDGFMAQGGDPTGSGMGGPGYEFVNEDNDLTFDKPGVVAMANAGRDTNGSQFFITFVPTPQLNGGYTIFGQVTEGMDVVNGIKRRNPDENPNFQGDAIQTIEITSQ